ncbi:MAG: carboxypeptidase M32 [Candidatus Thorarchaeota archaeon]
MDSYEKLCEKTKTTIQFLTGAGIVQWDMQTMIPPRAHQQRADQLAVMSKIAHQLSTDSEIRILLSEIEPHIHTLDKYQQREIALVRRNWKLHSALPEKLVREEVKQKSIATTAWRKAKTASDWKIFQPELEKLLSVSKERAELLMDPTGTSKPYDALLDIHSPNLTSKIVSKVFKELRSKLVPLAKKYGDTSQGVRSDFTKFKVPVEVQRNLVTDLVNYVGFDTISENAGGRIDESAHPFTSSYFDDTRMTVHYVEDNIFQAIFGGLHEAGHSIQGQSRNPKWKWMFLGEKSSAGINESQARFVENIVGRSPEFWNGYYDRFLKHTGSIFKDVTQDEFVQAANIVKSSKIRVTADEMTYALHIIIRYEIELALFSGELLPKEIPQMWNDKYDEYLGVEIENDAEGALQDTHWAWAYWGYFPTYSLGNIYSGMILETLQDNVPNWKEDLSNGIVESTINWLKENVHFKANLYDPGEMMENITGKKLAAKPFIDYLEKKYSTIFD